MATIGLLGDEYDSCIGILKVRIEDAGHTARIFNLRHFPRVTRASLHSDRIIYDGFDLLSIDCFYLRELGTRDPFFHVQYTEELWATLCERYNAFSSSEVENIPFAVCTAAAVAARKPVINQPDVYSLKRLMPFQIARLARNGFRVAKFLAGVRNGEHMLRTLEESLETDLEEQNTYDVPSFPKGSERIVQLKYKRIPGARYTAFVLGERIVGCALSEVEDENRIMKIDIERVPMEILETACKATGALGMVFARVDLCLSKEDNTVRVISVDPAPNFYEFEAAFGMPLSEALASYLLCIASKGPQ